MTRVNHFDTFASWLRSGLPIALSRRNLRALEARALRDSTDGALMIHLTRLNNQPLIVNADLIKFIENAPDTVITLLTGEKLVVRESAEEVLKRIGEFQERFYRRAGPGIVFDTSLPEGGSSGIESSHHSPKDENS